MNSEKNGFTKSGGSPPKTPRKLSWQHEDLAFKIQLAPRQTAATNLLRFLGKAANDGGTSHHGYASLMANCGIRSRSSIADAVKYLLTVGIDEKQPILTRTKGGIGKETSHYKLHLGAMQALVKHQGIFEVETGKLIRHHPDQKPTEGVPLNSTPTEEGCTAEQGEGVTLNGTGGVSLNGLGCTAESNSNPHIAPIDKPKDNPLSEAPNDWTDDVSSFDSEKSHPAEPGKDNANPHGNGSPSNSSGGGLKSSKLPVFTLKRWCPTCNEPSMGTEEDPCPHCGEQVFPMGNWLKAPRSDAEGKRLMEQLLQPDPRQTELERREIFTFASPAYRRWISLGKYADEMATVLGESK